MKRLFTLTNKKPIIDFLNAIYKDNISDNTKITYLNKELTEENPFKDAVFQSLYSDLRLLVVDGSRTFKYDIEFQTKEDKSIALRLFRYSINLEAQSLQKASNKMVIELPKPFVIILEKSNDVPDYYEVIIRLDSQELIYKCKTLKYWEYDINRLYNEHMYLLFPVKIIDVRSKIRKVKRSGKVDKGNLLIKEIRGDILKITTEILNYNNILYKQGLLTIAEIEEFGIILENIASYLNKEVDNAFNNINRILSFRGSFYSY